MNGNDAWSAVAELAASQHGVFSRKQAANNGVSNKRIRTAIRNGRVRPWLSDVFSFASHRPSFEQRLSIGSVAGGIASHRSAARLHRLDGFDRAIAVDVSFRRGQLRSIDDAHLHTWRYESRHDIAVIDGIRCTSIARTLVQLGAVVTRSAVEIALDSALRRGSSMAWIVETLERLRRPGVTGARVLQAVLDDPRRQALPESVLERRLERALLNAGLPQPVSQFPVDTPSGSYRADFAYPEARLLIEGHSMRFHQGSTSEDADMRRHLALTAAGFEVIYVTSAMLHSPDQVVGMVVAAYRRRVDPPASSGLVG